MALCPTLTPDGAFVNDVLGYIDCQAQTLGATGYQVLASPGSTGAIALTGVLTLFVALFGYRMLFGVVPDVRDAVVAMVKVGVVLALATSWPAYRTILYDLALRAPAEITADVGRQSALPGAGGGLEAQLQAVDDGLAELVRIGTGRPPNTDETVGPTAQPLTPQEQAQQRQRLQELSQRPRWDRQRDQELLATARTVYLTGAIGSLAAVRLIAGVLLALGPIFLLFLLFDTTRGVFEGWIRGLLAAALGGVSTALLLGIELAVMGPWLTAILAERQANLPTPSVPIELLSLSLIFASTLFAGLMASVRVAHGLHVPAAVRAVPSRLLASLRSEHVAQPVVSQATGEPPAERSRAHAISDAVAATQRRDARAQIVPPSPGSQLRERGGNPQTPARAPDGVAVVPIGQSARRRTAQRVSAGANRRNAL